MTRFISAFMLLVHFKHRQHYATMPWRHHLLVGVSTRHSRPRGIITVCCGVKSAWVIRRHTFSRDKVAKHEQASPVAHDAIDEQIS